MQEYTLNIFPDKNLILKDLFISSCLDSHVTLHTKVAFLVTLIE